MYFETPPILNNGRVGPSSYLLRVCLKSQAGTLASRHNVFPRITSLQHTWLVKRVWQCFLSAKISDNESNPVHTIGQLSSSRRSVTIVRCNHHISRIGIVSKEGEE
jgi:hypothetical protein